MIKYFCNMCSSELIWVKQMSRQVYLEPCALCIKRAQEPPEKMKCVAKSHHPAMVTGFIMDEDGY